MGAQCVADVVVSVICRAVLRCNVVAMLLVAFSLWLTVPTVCCCCCCCVVLPCCICLSRTPLFDNSSPPPALKLLLFLMIWCIGVVLPVNYTVSTQTVILWWRGSTAQSGKTLTWQSLSAVR